MRSRHLGWGSGRSPPRSVLRRLPVDCDHERAQSTPSGHPWQAESQHGRATSVTRGRVTGGHIRPPATSGKHEAGDQAATERPALSILTRLDGLGVGHGRWQKVGRLRLRQLLDPDIDIGGNVEGGGQADLDLRGQRGWQRLDLFITGCAARHCDRGRRGRTGRHGYEWRREHRPASRGPCRGSAL